MDKAAVIEWLEQVEKLDELIRAKRNDIADIMDRATKITASIDGMPHGSGKSDKVGDNAVKLADNRREELHTLERKKEYIIKTIETLPAKEYGVIYREFVLLMTQEQIAFDMCYSTVQIWRFKKQALKRLGEILEKKGDRF